VFVPGVVGLPPGDVGLVPGDVVFGLVPGNVVLGLVSGDVVFGLVPGDVVFGLIPGDAGLASGLVPLVPGALVLRWGRRCFFGVAGVPFGELVPIFEPLPV
jgi:hypothetical protein